MKKFYLFALAAATTAAAFAGGRQTSVVNLSAFSAQEDNIVMKHSPAKAATVGFKNIDEVAGEYAWSYYGLLSNDQGNQSGIVTLTVTDAAKGEVTIEGIFSAGTGITGKIKGTVDLTAGTLTMANKQSLGNDSYGDPNYFYLKELDSDSKLVDGASSVASVVATIDGKSFTFPDNMVFAIGDFNDESAGWWKLTALNSFDEMEAINDTLDPAEWKDYSTAKMIDGWVVPVLQYQSGEFADPKDFPLNVKVLQNKENPKLLALENPYMQTSGFPLSGGTSGYIVFDVTDPEFVLAIPQIYSGYSNGTNKLYCLNIEGYYVSAGYTKAVIQQNLTDITEWSSYKETGDNIVISIPTCRFNYPAALDKLYTWTNRADAMKATITIAKPTNTGVETIGIEEAAPMYFNLQGVQIAEPEKGIYIEVRGNKARKVVK